MSYWTCTGLGWVYMLVGLAMQELSINRTIHELSLIPLFLAVFFLGRAVYLNHWGGK